MFYTLLGLIIVCAALGLWVMCLRAELGVYSVAVNDLTTRLIKIQNKYLWELKNSQRSYNRDIKLLNLYGDTLAKMVLAVKPYDVKKLIPESLQTELLQIVQNLEAEEKKPIICKIIKDTVIEKISYYDKDMKQINIPLNISLDDESLFEKFQRLGYTKEEISNIVYEIIDETQKTTYSLWAGGISKKSFEYITPTKSEEK